MKTKGDHDSLSMRFSYLIKLSIIKIILPLYRWVFTQSDTNSIFSGKRVAIVGPATSAFGTGKGNYIDQFDIIIRINHGPRLLCDDLNHKDIGSRTDVLFHNINESEYKTLEFDIYDAQGLKYMITYMSDGMPLVDIRIVRYLRLYRNRLKNKLVVVSPPIIKYLIASLHSKFPTTGLIAIYTVLLSDFKELFITGITFGKTPYMVGYDDRRQGKGIDLREYLNNNRIHSTANELQFFKYLIREKRDKIVLDSVLENILEAKD